MPNDLFNRIRLPGDQDVWYKYGIYPVIGTQTAATQTWTGNIDLPRLYDGLTIAYYLPYDGKSSKNVTLELTLNDNTTTGAIAVYETGNNRITTHYAAGSTIVLTYWSAGSISIAGTATTVATWRRADYSVTNTNNAVNQNIKTDDVDRPLLMANYATGSTTTTATSANRAQDIYANASTGKVTATTFAGDLDGTINSDTTATTQSQGDNSTKVATTAYVDTAIDNLPEPMIFKGTLGTGGTITSLPAAATTNEGFTYKVITDGTYASIAAKVGDVFVSNGSSWIVIPAGDTDTDTWRNIKINGTEKLGSGISTGTVDFVNGTNTTVSFDSSGNKISISATDTKNTTGSTDTSSKIYLVGATSQDANPQTYSDDEIYATSGVLTTKSVQVGGNAATIQFNSTDNSIEFIFT